MKCWTNGALLVVASEQEIRGRGGGLLEDKPLMILAETLGERSARAIYRLLQEAVPGFTTDVSPVWTPLDPHSWIEIWLNSTDSVVVQAGALAEKRRGVVADLIDARWVARD